MHKEAALAQIDNKQELICRVNDKIWENPELGFEEAASARILCEALKSEGFAVETGLAGIPTAFSGRFGKGGPVIGILAEFDALSGMSQKAGVFHQEPVEEGGNGHGCGHNSLGAGSLAAAIAVKQYLEDSGMPGTVVFLGCPAEEGGSGKAFMARDGVFDELDFALCWHPNELNAVWAFSTLANIQVRYHFKGKSAHAGMSPHLGRSALDAAELMNVGAQFLREHIVPEARLHYAFIKTGGSSPNVVQPEAELLYLVRAPKSAQVQEIVERVHKIAQGAAMMTETEVEYQLVKGCSNIIPNNVLEQVLYENMKEIPLPGYTGEEKEFARKMRETITPKVSLGDKLAQAMGPKAREMAAPFEHQDIYEFVAPYLPSDRPLPGSSDVGDVSWVCPTAQVVTATTCAGTVNHSWQQVAQGKHSIAHKGLLYAGKVLAGAAIDLLNKPELIESAKAEHKSRVGETGYVPLIPKGLRPSALSGEE